MSRPIDEPALLRTLLRILRHAASDYWVELDAAGWADVRQVVGALRCCRRAWSRLQADELRQFITERQSDRIELQGDRLRARYGHSLPGIIESSPIVPPARLFHGTQRTVLAAIWLQGLDPRGRSHVHLTSELEYALGVATAKGDRPVVLRVDSQAAHAAGQQFWRVSAHVWLTGALAAHYLAVADSYGL